jgi:cytochrome c oxidase cbb3-type subunit 3
MRVSTLCAVSFLCAATQLAAADAPAIVLERGRTQFKAACGFCHGDDATGSRAPDLIRSPVLSHDVSGELLKPVIKEGRPEKGMPAFPNLTDSQISDMVAFLHAQALAALHSAHVPRDYPVEKLLTGNAEAGKAFFNGAGGCYGCHSPTGDLAGVAKKHSPLDLQSRFLYPAGTKSTVTVTLRSGKQVSGTLLHKDEFNVAMRDSSGWYRSWPLDQVKAEVHDPLEAHRQLLYKYKDADVHNLFAYLESLK